MPREELPGLGAPSAILEAVGFLPEPPFLPSQQAWPCEARGATARGFGKTAGRPYEQGRGRGGGRGAGVVTSAARTLAPGWPGGPCGQRGLGEAALLTPTPESSTFPARRGEQQHPTLRPHEGWPVLATQGRLTRSLPGHTPGAGEAGASQGGPHLIEIPLGSKL